jgi:site-specific DNA recombinase
MSTALEEYYGPGQERHLRLVLGRHDEDLDRILSLREFLRVSIDKSGVERSPEEQHEDHANNIGRHPRLQLSDLPPYREVARASHYATKKRKQFKALMTDIESGAFAADGLLMWENSRTSRRADEWLALIKLCEDRGKVIVIASHGFRVYDPANRRDWEVLVQDALDAEKESRVTSERVKRAMKANAEDGKWQGGRRAFGLVWDKPPSDKSRKLVRCEPEITLIEEAVERVLGGDSVRSIAQDWNERTPPVMTVTGGQWYPGVLRNMLASPRLAGLRAHGVHEKDPKNPTLKPRPRVVASGQWPAIIPVATHKLLVSKLDSRTPVGRRTRRSWLLTGLLVCGFCNERLVPQTDGTGVRRYICRSSKAPGYHGCGRIGIKAQDTEDVIREAVLVRLRTDLLTEAEPDDDEATVTAALRVERDRLDVELANLANEVGTPDGPTPKFANMRAKSIEARQDEIELALAGMTRRVRPRDLVVAAGIQGKPWREYTEDQKRTVLDGYLEYVKVGPATKRGSTKFEPERLKPKWVPLNGYRGKRDDPIPAGRPRRGARPKKTA